MTTVSPPTASVPCPGCGTALALTQLSCPACQRLVHTDRLSALAGSAQQAEAAQQWSEALRLWREALELLPPQTQQFETVARKVEALSHRVDEGVAAPRPKWTKALGPLAPLLLLLWKFKGLALLALSKGKLLLFGLTKLSTLSTMLLSLGAYWLLYGWPFAVGLVLSIYVHEMGHISVLRKFGIRATAPMFIPLLGAVVGLRQHHFTPREDARIGLGGPTWGMVGAIVTFAAYALTQNPMLAAVGHVAAWINLFNLLPIWQLDGGRAMHALSRAQRGLLLVAILVLWAVTHEGFLVLLAGVTTYRLFSRDWPEEGDWKTVIQFVGLLVGLSLLLAIPAPRVR